MKNDQIMINSALIGDGNFGKILKSKLSEISNLLWTSTSADDYQIKQLPEWVFIATPNEMHFEHASFFLSRGINVFLEKPATYSTAAFDDLVKLAKNSNSKLFIDEVFLYRNDIRSLLDEFKPGIPYSFIWHKADKELSLSILYDLAYHDLYTIHKSLHNAHMLKVAEAHLDHFSKKLSFTLTLDGQNYSFEYGSLPNQNIFFNTKINRYSNDALLSM